MTLVKKTIGRNPLNFGNWDTDFINPKTQLAGYGKKFRVFLYGCEFESLMENNTYAPATLVNGLVTPDTVHWRLATGMPANYGLDGKLSAETARAMEVEGGHETRISDLEESVGTGGSVDERIAAEATAREAAVSAETTRATAAEENLRTLYNNLQQSQPVPVTELPATGEAGKIYRLAGTTSYADYMYAEEALTTPIKMAEYDNAIDDEPIDESNNLAKSGGTAKQIRVQSTKIVNDTTGLQIIDITYNNKGIRTINVESVNIQNPAFYDRQGVKCILAQCNEGDVFTVIHRTYSGTPHLRGYMWLGAPDSSGNCAILSTQTLANSQTEEINQSYVAPTGAAYVVFNGTELVVTRGIDAYLNSNYLNTITDRQIFEQYIDNIQEYIGETDYKLITEIYNSNLAKEGDIIRVEVTGIGTSIASFSPKMWYENSGDSNYFKVEKNVIDIPVRHNDLSQVGVRFYKRDVLSDGSVTLKIYLISRGYSAAKKELKILVIGSSSEQSYIPYLPPILNEALPGYEITYGNMYTSGADAAGYVNQYKNSTPCTKFNYWGSKDDKWTRYTNSYTLEDVLNKEKWNLIIFKGTITASRQLMRIIQSIVDYPVNFMTNARYSRKYDNKQKTTEETCLDIINAREDEVKQTGFMDYIPVGTAIQNARTNSIIKKAGITWGETRQFSIPANSYLKLEQKIRGLSTSPTLKARRVSGSGEIIIECDSYRVFTLADNQEYTTVFSSADTSYIKFTNTGSDPCVIEFVNKDSIGDYLLNDDQHLQAGIAILIAAYTYALKIMDYTGNFHRGINGLCNKFSFIPTVAELSAIGVGDGNMDHGKPCGIVDYIGSDDNHYDMSQLTTINGTLYIAETVFNDTPDANSVTATAGNIIYKNIYAAQEIAEIAVGNPTEIIDCSNIVIDIPQKN